MGYGTAICKFTGAGGKSGSNDASAEFAGELRRLLDANDVNWQVAELGKVDAGGGGTVAKYIAKLNVDTIDIGVPVISMEPEYDAISHIRNRAKELGIVSPEIIGWDFPVVSPEQANVFNMHGYAAALILRDEADNSGMRTEVFCQQAQKYIVITIKDPMSAPFRLIPNAYKVLMTHMKVNGINHKEDPKVISCFEKEYEKDGVHYMDVYIAVE